MKSYYHIIVLFLALGFVSCDDYLDLVPDDVATIESAFTTRATAERYLYTCYSFCPPIGDINDDIGINGGVETWQYYSSSLAQWVSSRAQRGTEESVTSPLLNFWDGERCANHSDGKWGLFQGIRDVNIFLENVDKPVDLLDYERTRWIAEAKFLKAYFHYYLWKTYGPIPITDKNISVGASPNEVQVYRDPSDDVVNYCDSLFMEAYKGLPDCKDIQSNELGRADKQICLTLRAQMLLYAASPLFNGNTDYAGMVDNKGRVLFNQTYDANKWKRAADACKLAIQSCEASGKKLYSDVEAQTISQDSVFQLQTTLRQVVCKRWNSELIWGSVTCSNNTELQQAATPRLIRMSPDIYWIIGSSWAPTINTVEKFYTNHGVPMSEDKEWINNKWYENRYGIRPEPASEGEKYYVHLGSQTCYMHFNREPRFYAFVGFDQGEYYGSGKFDWGESDAGDIHYSNFLAKQTSGRASSIYSVTGYSPKKMHHFGAEQTYSQLASPEYYPFPILRLADLYLMYSEALNEFSGPSEEVYKYIDLVRKRAGLEGVVDSWTKYATDPSKPKTKEGMREIIKQERSCELCFESKYYWDIRRWKDMVKVYNAQPKGWYTSGETPEDFYKVVNLAKVPLNVSVKNYFYPIKEYDLTLNKNLIQNYGW